MKTSDWHDRFIEILYEKYPKKADLAQELMDLLYIEREAVYRRLRKEVKFSFQEIAKVASAWSISLDWLIYDYEQVPFQMQLVDYLSPKEKDLGFVQAKVEYFDYIKHSNNSEYMAICNKLPKSLITGFENLYRFELFRWTDDYSNNGNTGKSFSQTIIPSELLKMMPKYFNAIKNTTSVNYIWDQMLLERLICDIRYFHSIRMVTDDEKELIKQDLYALMDYLFEIVNHGYFPETRNEVNFYISQVSINTNYSYLYTENVKICCVHVFNKYEIYSLDQRMINNFRIWMQLKKRSSILISKVDKKERIVFFTKQQQLIDSL
jgi:hypothetical protein